MKWRVCTKYVYEINLLYGRAFYGGQLKLLPLASKRAVVFSAATADSDKERLSSKQQCVQCKVSRALAFCKTFSENKRIEIIRRYLRCYQCIEQGMS